MRRGLTSYGDREFSLFLRKAFKLAFVVLKLLLSLRFKKVSLCRPFGPRLACRPVTVVVLF